MAFPILPLRRENPWLPTNGSQSIDPDFPSNNERHSKTLRPLQFGPLY